MASVFLSYDREDTAVAGNVARALEKAGHSVWWDRQIAGGAQYETAIEQALSRSDAVVVLWSAGSVKSAWVKDEAAAGRDAEKLVPARLDSVEPPLGFRQYQTVDLTRWKGRAGSGSFKELLHGIENLSPGATVQPPVTSFTEPQQSRWFIPAAILALLLVAAGAWLVVPKLSKPDVPLVSVAAADNSRSSQQLARDLFVKLGMLPEQGERGMRLVEAGEAEPNEADFLVEIGASAVSRTGANLVLLTGKKRALLWSKDFEVPADRLADLKEQAAYTTARVLDCALEARGAGERIDEQLTKRYLEGCSVLAGYTGVFVEPALPAFREVTRRAPDFEEGWSKLLLAEAQVATASDWAKEDPRQGLLQQHIAEARRRFPENAAATYAQIELLPTEATFKRLALSEAAVIKHEDHPFLLEQRSLLLFRVGRVDEAVEHARAAADADPLSSKLRSHYVAVLAYAGLLDRAKSELEKGEKLWPGTFAMMDASSRIHARFGDPKKALAIQRSGVFGNDGAMEAFLLARIDPSPANIDRAIAANMKMFGRDPRALGFLMQAYGAFGKEEELYKFFSRASRALPIGPAPVGTAGVLFRAPLRKFRQDRRFMSVAQRFGLIDYWQKSGKWPDFCFEPDLPYDCKDEAAKLRKTA